MLAPPLAGSIKSGPSDAATFQKELPPVAQSPELPSANSRLNG
jgi:hypothetical protein